MPDRVGMAMLGTSIPENFDLLQHAMEHGRSCAEDLTKPDDDILPVLMWLGPYGVGVMPLLDMSSDDAKDDMAAMMTTMLAVGRAQEAVQITTSWAVMQQPDENGKFTGPMPSKHPDRVECIVLMHMKPEEDCDTMVRGDLTRYEDKPPTLGEWQVMDTPSQRIAGRFGDAIHMGMDFATQMPPELVQIIDAGWAEEKQGDLIRRFHNVFVQFTGAMEAMRQAGMDTQLKLKPEDDTARANMPLVDPVNRPEPGNE